MLNLYPQPNLDPTTHGGNNYEYIDNVPQNRWEWTTRIDYSMSENTKLFGTYMRQDEKDIHPFTVWWAPSQSLPYPSTILGPTTSNLATLNLMHVFSPSLTNELVGSRLPPHLQCRRLPGNGKRQSHLGVASCLCQKGHRPARHEDRSISFDDLRNTPARLIGGFNNHWTLEMTNDLRFVFDQGTRIWDRQDKTRSWTEIDNSQGLVTDDYAVISRVLNSKTGASLVTLAGIGIYGTQAAGEFIRGCFINTV